MNAVIVSGKNKAATLIYNAEKKNLKRIIAKKPQKKIAGKAGRR